MRPRYTSCSEKHLSRCHEKRFVRTRCVNRSDWPVCANARRAARLGSARALGATTTQVPGDRSQLSVRNILFIYFTQKEVVNNIYLFIYLPIPLSGVLDSTARVPVATCCWFCHAIKSCSILLKIVLCFCCCLYFTSRWQALHLQLY